MLNLFRAQWYRLVRNRAFWGLLVVYGLICTFALVSLGSNYHGQEGFWDLPSLLPLADAALFLDPQDYLGRVGGALWVPLLTCLLVATFFADDLSDGSCRNLAVSTHFRPDYLVSAAVLTAGVAVLFVVVGFAVVLAVTSFFPHLSVTWEMGRFGRWALAVVLASVVYGMLTLAVALISRRLALAVLFGFLLALGQVEVGILALVDLAGECLVSLGIASPWSIAPLSPDMFMRNSAERHFQDWALAFPAGQLGGPLSSLYEVPTAVDMLVLVAWLAAAMGLCWIIMRRKRL